MNQNTDIAALLLRIGLGTDVDPELVRTNPEEAFNQFCARAFPMQRPQTVEEIGKAVAYLASDDARNITGQCLHVDGGAVVRD